MVYNLKTIEFNRKYYFLRASTIFTKERPFTSSTVIPVLVTSSILTALQLKARRKKFNNPCPVAASSKLCPTKVA